MAHVRPSSSAVDIANQALILLGAEAITSFADGDKNSDVMARLYEQTKHALFRSYPWNFAQRRARLPQIEEKPLTSEFNFQYQLPADYIRLLEIWSEKQGNSIVYSSSMNYARPNGDDSYHKWSVEGRRVLCNANPVFAVYIADVDEGDFSFSFTEALINFLAAKAAYGITGSNTRTNALTQQAQGSLQEAYTSDALEKTTKSLKADRFTQVRL